MNLIIPIKKNGDFTEEHRQLAESLIRKDQIKKRKEPLLSKYILRGSTRKLVQTAPARVMAVAAHFK